MLEFLRTNDRETEIHDQEKGYDADNDVCHDINELWKVFVRPFRKPMQTRS